MNVPTIMEDVSILVIIQLVVTTVHVILAISLTLTTIIVMVRLLILLLHSIIIYNQLSDMDECTLGINGCNQNCVNTEGTYLCSCFAGYQLGSDNHTCLGKNISHIHD